MPPAAGGEGPPSTKLIAGTPVRLWNAVAVLRGRRPTARELSDLASRYAGAPPTYEQLGATLSGVLPPGYVHDDESVLLGHGDDTFRAGRTALIAWAAHRGSGIVVSEDAQMKEGRTVALAAPLPVGVALAVCRIIRVVDEPDRFGFAYGTLPLHPEEGEEAFLIERDADGQVRFRIVAFSKPRFWAARLVRPAARVLQLRALRSYLRAMRQAVSPGQ